MRIQPRKPQESRTILYDCRLQINEIVFIILAYTTSRARMSTVDRQIGVYYIEQLCRYLKTISGIPPHSKGKQEKEKQPVLWIDSSDVQVFELVPVLRQVPSATSPKIQNTIVSLLQQLTRQQANSHITALKCFPDSERVGTTRQYLVDRNSRDSQLLCHLR